MTLRGEGYRIDGIRGSKIRDDVLDGGRACRNNIFVSLSRLARARCSVHGGGGKGNRANFRRSLRANDFLSLPVT